MGRRARPKQKRLGTKLRQIREALGLSQDGILRHLGCDKELLRTNVSSWEVGDREPALYVLLRYAKTAGICLDVLIDDELDLPRKIPSRVYHKRSR